MPATEAAPVATAGLDALVADAGEQKDFLAPSTLTWAAVQDTSNLYAYLHPYQPYAPPIAPADSDFQPMVVRQTQRVVNYIRGADQAEETVGAVTLPAMRRT